MAQYLILIYQPERPEGEQIPPEVWQQAMEAHGRFAELLVESGAKMLGVEALQPSSTASGLTVLTRIPFGPPSSARQRARCREAAFADE